MAGSRSLWETITGTSDQSATPLNKKQKAANKKRAIDKIPGDKGSTVHKLRSRKQKIQDALDAAE